MLAVGADVICLQETTPRTLELWTAQLAGAGYRGIAHGALAHAGQPRPLAVLSAARQPLRPVPVPDIPWPERVLAVTLADGSEIVNVHSPISPKADLVKVRTHEALHRYLARDTSGGRRRILCGDLNTPRREYPDGSVMTFAHDRYRRLIPERGERWDEAERSLIRGLEPHGYRDAFRLLHGDGSGEFSWGWPRHRGGYRLDHLIVSAAVGVEACAYEHSWRREGLSDHSALIARLSG